VTADVGEDLEKDKHSSIAGGIASWYNYSPLLMFIFRKLQSLPLTPFTTLEIFTMIVNFGSQHG
jgi:hypothetical protein